jgi:hypothetical protein
MAELGGWKTAAPAREGKAIRTATITLKTNFLIIFLS